MENQEKPKENGSLAQQAVHKTFQEVVTIDQMTTEQLEAALEAKRSQEKQLQKQKERQYELSKHEYVESVVVAFEGYNKELQAFKELALNTGKELYEKMFSIYGKELKDTKSFSIESKDGCKKIEIQYDERVEFDERAIVHIGVIKQVFRDKFQDRNKKMYNMLETLLVKNKGGDYDPKLLTKLNKHREDVDDERFTTALDELAKCHKISGTGKYLRAYKRRDLDDKWECIQIQFSTL